MGGSFERKRRTADPAVGSYVESVRDDRRKLFDTLETLILTLYPEAEIHLAYGVPTYGTKPARVGLGYWEEGVSFYPYSGSALDEFRVKHPAIKTNKGSVNFKVTDEIPVASLRKLIRQAMRRRRSS